MANSPPATINPDDFLSRLNSESDRACGVLGAALLDVRLEQLLRNRFQTLQKELLGRDRPLSTLSARARLARAVGWISEDVYRDIDLVRQIRNRFAHAFDHTLDFADSQVSGWCTSLRTAQAFLAGCDDAAALGTNVSSAVFVSIKNTFSSPRWRYQLAIEFLAQYLDEATTSEQLTDLIAEVRSLSANQRFVVSAGLLVGEAPAHSEP